MRKKNNQEYELPNAKTKPNKIFEIIGVSLWPPSSPDLNPLDYAIWVVLETKTNVSSHLNIGLLKTAIDKELNRMFEEFTLKAGKLFQKRVDTKKK